MGALSTRKSPAVSGCHCSKSETHNIGGCHIGTNSAWFILSHDMIRLQQTAGTTQLASSLLMRFPILCWRLLQKDKPGCHFYKIVKLCSLRQTGTGPDDSPDFVQFPVRSHTIPKTFPLHPRPAAVQDRTVPATTSRLCWHGQFASILWYGRREPFLFR